MKEALSQSIFELVLIELFFLRCKFSSEKLLSFKVLERFLGSLEHSYRWSKGLLLVWIEFKSTELWLLSEILIWAVVMHLIIKGEELLHSRSLVLSFSVSFYCVESYSAIERSQRKILAIGAKINI